MLMSLLDTMWVVCSSKVDLSVLNIQMFQEVGHEPPSCGLRELITCLIDFQIDMIFFEGFIGHFETPKFSNNSMCVMLFNKVTKFLTLDVPMT